MRASRRLSAQEPDQRSGTRVTARPDEQFAPNRPIFSAFSLYIAMRERMDAVGACTVSPFAGTGGLHGVMTKRQGFDANHFFGRHGLCLVSPRVRTARTRAAT